MNYRFTTNFNNALAEFAVSPDRIKLVSIAIGLVLCRQHTVPGDTIEIDRYYKANIHESIRKKVYLINELTVIIPDIALDTAERGWKTRAIACSSTNPSWLTGYDPIENLIGIQVYFSLETKKLLEAHSDEFARAITFIQEAIAELDN